jgi:hypothetical protein
VRYIPAFRQERGNAGQLLGTQRNDGARAPEARSTFSAARMAKRAEVRCAFSLASKTAKCKMRVCDMQVRWAAAPCHIFPGNGLKCKIKE